MKSRLIGYPIIFLAVEVVVVAIGVLLGQGINNALGGQPVGTDFLSFYSVSSLILDGHPVDAYGTESLHAVQQEIAGSGSPFYGWLYPPIAMLLVAPLSLLPYGASLIVWLLLTGLVYVSGLRRLLPFRRAWLPILAFPGVFLSIGHGQNSLLSAGLLAWALVLLPKSGWLGGALAGLLIFKPQLGLLLPVAFLAARNIRAFVGATVSVIALSALSLAVFGAKTWTAFLAGSGFAVDVLEEGGVSWEKMISAFAAARLLGLPSEMAWVVQGALTIASGVLVWLFWSRGGPYQLKVAALALGTVVATPFALDYEATFVGLALAAMVALGIERGFLPWEKSVYALLWVSPLFWRVAATSTGFPLGFLTVVAAAVLLLRRASAAGWNDDVSIGQRSTG